MASIKVEGNWAKLVDKTCSSVGCWKISPCAIDKEATQENHSWVTALSERTNNQSYEAHRTVSPTNFETLKSWSCTNWQVAYKLTELSPPNDYNLPRTLFNVIFKENTSCNKMLKLSDLTNL